jgi:hypothetical protein
MSFSKFISTIFFLFFIFIFSFQFVVSTAKNTLGLVDADSGTLSSLSYMPSTISVQSAASSLITDSAGLFLFVYLLFLFSSSFLLSFLLTNRRFN